MPHIIIDYSANLEPHLELDALLASVHEDLIEMQLFPTGGIRSRARRIDHYRFADGARDYSGIHVEVLLSSLRPLEIRKEVGQRVFNRLQPAIQKLREHRPYIALSLSVGSIDAECFFNDNDIHQIFGFPEQ